MSFLKDAKWDEMDWLNKAVEPFTFSLNQTLEKIPSTYVVRYDEIVNHVGSYSVDFSTLVRNMLESAKLTEEELSLVSLVSTEALFSIHVEPDTTLDLDAKTINGALTVSKKIESFSDDHVAELIPRLVHQFLYSSWGKADSSRLNEVMDILDCKEARKTSSSKKKKRGLELYLLKTFRDNTWNIKNVDLIIKFLQWIIQYIDSGDRCSLANLSKLKCMTYSGNPIYSMEEII